MKQIIFFIILYHFFGVCRMNGQTYFYDFSDGFQGWEGDFADYPVGDSAFYELEFSRPTLPPPLDESQWALRISGNNHSDDLFMFVKRKIEGLRPNKFYSLRVDIEVASCEPTGRVGVGGAPGESVIFKAGATLVEPVKVNKGDNFYRINIDKGNQARGGFDMQTIGHAGVSDTTSVYTLISRSNKEGETYFTTDSTGEVWVCIGTESGFEAATTLYYNTIKLTFYDFLNIKDSDATPSKKVLVYPNPVKETLSIVADKDLVGKRFDVFDITGRCMISGWLTDDETLVSVDKLPHGVYFIKTGDLEKHFVKFIKN